MSVLTHRPSPLARSASPRCLRILDDGYPLLPHVPVHFTNRFAECIQAPSESGQRKSRQKLELAGISWYKRNKRKPLVHSNVSFSPALQALIDAEARTSANGLEGAAPVPDDPASPTEAAVSEAAGFKGTAVSASSLPGASSSSNASTVSRLENVVGAVEAPGRKSPAEHPGVVRLVLKGSSITENGLRGLWLHPSKCRHSLEHLDVSGCARLGLNCLSHIPRGSSLRILTANGCGSIRDLSLAFPPDCPLERMSLQRCPHLTSLQLTAPQLQHLAVSSGALHSVSLTTPVLHRLRVMHCPQLASLEIHGPPATAAAALVHLDLSGCARLQSVVLQTILASATRLECCNISGCQQFGAVVIPGALLVQFMCCTMEVVCRFPT